jgi:hypothetical protein
MNENNECNNFLNYAEHSISLDQQAEVIEKK